MKIQCDCGKFKAELENFSSSPGRLVCYCEDCQRYLDKIDRKDVLDPYGGTQVIPVYPNDFKIIEGEDFLQCNLLSPKGLNRWTAKCCNTPVANTMAKFPWVGIPHTAFTKAEAGSLEKIGKIKSRIKGKYKTSKAPFEISDNLKLGDMLVVLPFIAKGFLFKKFSKSPFFKEDGVTPVKEANLLSKN